MLLQLSTLAALISAASAHIALSSPCPRYGQSEGCPSPPQGETVDYDINSPIGSQEAINNPICKHTKPFDSPVAKWTAGDSIEVKFGSGATHGGGHCQFAISYDGGKSFVVIHDEFKTCLVKSESDSSTPVSTYNIKLPADLPSSKKAIFAWGWNNAIGAREFYMNCADVEISGNGKSFTGPQMIYPNYGPDAPKIAEFNGNYETGLDVFKQRKNITVSGDGSGSSSGQGGSGEESAPASDAPSGAASDAASGYDSAPANPLSPADGLNSLEAPTDPSGGAPSEGGIPDTPIDGSGSGSSGAGQGNAQQDGSSNGSDAGQANGGESSPFGGNAQQNGSPSGSDAGQADGGESSPFGGNMQQGGFPSGSGAGKIGGGDASPFGGSDKQGGFPGGNQQGMADVTGAGPVPDGTNPDQPIPSYPPTNFY
ncbi:hypothetical protein H4219_001306 [Mycoemilia scoparia]|uniref:Chitin-binding type-4 domain-containing protein n=1 Tax=Mycoemilia scoparia TaxID=417184 RepID=A0A9W8A708_9FUNG|nr:hypothetical protein H4219_001306 [Mycoemilia scoparia]